MIKQESTYDKETGEIIDYKEYHDNLIIKHHINEKNHNSIKLYNEGILYHEQIREIKNQRDIFKTLNGNGEILEHNEFDLNGNLRLEVFKGPHSITSVSPIRTFKFDNKSLNKKYSYYAYKLKSSFILNEYYLQLETSEILNDYTYVRYSKKYPVNQVICTQLCTWNQDTFSSIIKLNKKQLEYINDIIHPKKKPYEQSQRYHK